MTPVILPQRPMTAGEWTLLLALATVWGGSFFLNEVALAELPVLTLVLARLALAALILLLLMRLRGERMPRDGGLWLAFLVVGFVNNALPFSLIVWAQQSIASGVASILNASTPLFTVLLAHLLTRDERMTAGKLAGVGIGFLGVAVMLGGAASGAEGGSAWAYLMCLGAAVCYGLGGIYGRRFRTMGVSPLATATGQLVAASLILMPLALALDRPWTLPPPGPVTLAALVGVATISTALAYVLYFRLLVTAGATNLLLVTFLVPVGAVMLGILVLGEVLLVRHVAGMALIGVGLAAIDGRPWQALRRRLRAG